MEFRGFQKAPNLVEAKPRQVRLTWLQKVQQSKRVSSHTVSWHPDGGMVCIVCCRRTRSEVQVRTFLGTECQHGGCKIGVGHNLSKTRGVLWCRACGEWGVHSLDKLSRTCLGVPRAHGRRATAALRSGRRP